MILSDELWDEVHDDNLPAIVWTTRATNFNEEGYTYAAFFANKLKRWYLAGDAIWYGERVITDDQMVELLRRDEVENLWRVQSWSPPLRSYI